MVAVVTAVIACFAMTVPTNWEPDPRVAELPTCQKTLQDVAPPVSRMWLPDAVFSVLAAWKTQTESAEPLRVRSPVTWRWPPE